jgi:protein SCO1/2
MLRLLFTACLVLVALTGVAQEYDKDSALAVSQAVSMIYTSCHHVCPTITRNLARNVEVAREALGEDAFSVVTIGFDWQVDSPERMRQFAAGQGVDDVEGWYFLAADAATIDALSENLGFLFFPSAKGFDHLVQTTIVGRDGTIYRQLYGVDIDTQVLVEPLKELVFDAPRSAGLIEHWVSTFKLFCTVYDPNSDRYRFDYSILTTIVVGLLCLGAIATFIVREWRGAR